MGLEPVKVGWNRLRKNQTFTDTQKGQLRYDNNYVRTMIMLFKRDNDKMLSLGSGSCRVVCREVHSQFS